MTNAQTSDKTMTLGEGGLALTFAALAISMYSRPRTVASCRKAGVVEPESIGFDVGA
jgi:hypothetical protein